MNSKVECMEEATVSKIKEIVNAETIIGKPITADGGVTIIPVSKVSYGFGSGGSDFSGKNSNEKNMFGGGSGAGVNITPVAFLVISKDDVKLLQVESFSGSLDRIIAMTPDLIDKFKKRKKKKEDKDEEIQIDFE